MAVSAAGIGESHTGTTGSASQASFDFPSFTPSATARGLAVGVIANNATNPVTSVVINPATDNITMTDLGTAYEAKDTAGEPLNCKVFFLGSGIPAGALTIRVNRANNATIMYAMVAAVAALGDTEAVGVVLVQEDGTLAVVAVDDGSPGTDSLRYAFGAFGHAAISAAGAGSTVFGAAGSIDFGAWVAGGVRETAAGQGSRSFGWSNGTADDRAAVHFAIREVTAGPTDFPLDAQPGSFTFTGTAASPVATRLVTANPTSYALTGLAAGVPVGRAIAALPGSYTLTGVVAGVLTTRTLDAATGAYTLTGFVAGTFATRTISADPGAYVLTGVDAELLYGALGPGAFQLDAQPAAFALTGAAAGVLATRLLVADLGTYTFTGVQAGVLADRILIAAPGSYAHTGVVAGLVRERTLIALPATYTLTGQPVSFVVTRTLVAAPGDYTLTGVDALLAALAALVPADLIVVASLASDQLIADNAVPIATIVNSLSDGTLIENNAVPKVIVEDT